MKIRIRYIDGVFGHMWYMYEVPETPKNYNIQWINLPETSIVYKDVLRVFKNRRDENGWDVIIL